VPQAGRPGGRGSEQTDGLLLGRPSGAPRVPEHLLETLGRLGHRPAFPQQGVAEARTSRPGGCSLQVPRMQAPPVDRPHSVPGFAAGRSPGSSAPARAAARTPPPLGRPRRRGAAGPWVQPAGAARGGSERAEGDGLVAGEHRVVREVLGGRRAGLAQLGGAREDAPQRSDRAGALLGEPGRSSGSGQSSTSARGPGRRATSGARGTGGAKCPTPTGRGHRRPGDAGDGPDISARRRRRPRPAR
jgi:hypothetical protein